MKNNQEVSDVQNYYNDTYLDASETERKYDDIAMLTPEERAQLTPVSPDDEEITILPNQIDEQLNVAYMELEQRMKELREEEAAEATSERWYDKQSAHEDVVYARRKVHEIEREIKDLEEAKANGQDRESSFLSR